MRIGSSSNSSRSTNVGVTNPGQCGSSTSHKPGAKGFINNNGTAQKRNAGTQSGSGSRYSGHTTSTSPYAGIFHP